MTFSPFQNWLVTLRISSYVAPGQKQKYFNLIKKASLSSVKKCSDINNASTYDKGVVKISTDSFTTDNKLLSQQNNEQKIYLFFYWIGPRSIQSISRNVHLCVCVCLFVPKVVIVKYAQMVRALFRDIMNLLNLEGHKSCMIGSIVTAIFTHLIYFKVFYSYLQKSKVKSINYKNIP